VRRFVALMLLAAFAGAEDAVHLANGGVFFGAVVEENDREVVLELEAGRIALPRAKVRLVERNATPDPLRKAVTWADEWFLILHRGKVVGWRHVVHAKAPDRLRAEERTVFFKRAGGEDVSIHRVEVSDPEGRPLEFLLTERYGDTVESVAGFVTPQQAVAYVRRGAKTETVTLDPAAGWVLELPAWARFRRDASEGETRTVCALDLRLLQPRTVLFRRDADEVAPDGADRRPCRALSLQRDERLERVLVRPDEGSVVVHLSGETLVARRATRERVEMAQAANAKRTLTVEEALTFPFAPKPPDRVARHVAGGVTLVAPDEGWVAASFDGERGRLLEFEKVGLFASLEVFVYDLPSPRATLEECFDRALSRMRCAATSVELEGERVARAAGGLPALVQEMRVDHRAEKLRSALFVARAEDRMVVLVGACPESLWRLARPAFESFAASLRVIP